METITLVVSMYDHTRRAEVTLPDEMTVGELMEQCWQRWSLPPRTFVFRHVGSDDMLAERESLRLAGVRDGAELQVYPILEGG